MSAFILRCKFGHSFSNYQILFNFLFNFYCFFEVRPALSVGLAKDHFMAVYDVFFYRGKVWRMIAGF